MAHTAATRFCKYRFDEVKFMGDVGYKLDVTISMFSIYRQIANLNILLIAIML